MNIYVWTFSSFSDIFSSQIILLYTISKKCGKCFLLCNLILVIVFSTRFHTLLISCTSIWIFIFLIYPWSQLIVTTDTVCICKLYSHLFPLNSYYWMTFITVYITPDIVMVIIWRLMKNLKWRKNISKLFFSSQCKSFILT